MPYVSLTNPQSAANLVHLNALVVRITYKHRKAEASAEVSRLPDPLPRGWTLLAGQAAYNAKVAEYVAAQPPDAGAGPSPAEELADAIETATTAADIRTAIRRYARRRAGREI